MSVKIPVTLPQLLIALAVFLFAAFAFWLRIIPLLTTGSPDPLAMVAMDDPLYNLRQTEIILAHFPQYSWFDAMTNYPYGTSIYWGPVLPMTIAILCLLTGAASQPEIIRTALLITPLFAAAIVVLMYWVGRAFGDWKTGFAASGFTAVITGQFFTYSMYGYIDHHIAEVFFSTLFCLLYTAAVLSVKETGIRLDDTAGWRTTAVLAFLAGIGYLLGLFTMPTMILFAMIVGLFTIIQSIVDVFRNRTTEYLVLINGIVFFTAAAGILLFGLRSPGINLSTYSIGHVYAYLALVAGTVLLYVLARALAGKSRWYYPAALAGIGVLFIGILAIALPEIYATFVNGFFAFFGQQAITETVLEAMGWSWEKAWVSYNYGLLLFAGGALVMIYNNWKDEHPAQVFALVWSLVMFISTWQHVRYEYYLSVNIALLSAVAVVFVIERATPTLSEYIPLNSLETSLQGQPGPEKTGKKRHAKQEKRPIAARSLSGPVSVVAVIVVLIVAALFCFTSAYQSYTNISDNGEIMNPDWRSSLEWLKANSPDPGVDPLALYNPATFTYPAGSYGVMSWWDYGHFITYVANRIPNANPFQQGVAGPNGSAVYFMTSSEDEANHILDNLGTRYVMTDTLMANGKFNAMATWYNASLGPTPYLESVYIPAADDSNAVESRDLFTKEYFHTMIARLHDLDGSYTRPEKLVYIEYIDPSVTSLSLPLVTSAVVVNETEAERRIDNYTRAAARGYHAKAVSASILSPSDPVPALRHYRLIHESPTNSMSGSDVLKFVKTFEYVPGARIHGTGIIAVPIMTNTGRTFTYYQESAGGEFIVPYSTSGSSYDTRATGKYRIVGTGQEFDVPESAVAGGLTIS